MLVLISCTSSRKKEINKIQQSVTTAERIIDRYDNNIQSAIDSRFFSYIDVASLMAQDSLEITINDLKKINPSDTSLIELKKVALDYISTFQNIITIEKGYIILKNADSMKKALDIDLKLSDNVKNSRKKRMIYQYKLKENISQ